jgi:predicted kinase
MLIKVPKLSLVVLIGPSGSGKTNFARRHFLATEILSSDACRAMVGDDENDQSVTKHAFEILHGIAAKRLELGKLTVIDATNVQPESRKPFVALARQYHSLPVAVVFDLPEQVCQETSNRRDSGSASTPERSAWSRPEPADGSSAIPRSSARFWIVSAWRSIGPASGRRWRRNGYASIASSCRGPRRPSGEGMVVKPLKFVHQGSRGLAQPALKCRGREYLRIIYGPEYTKEEDLVRLRARGPGRKRSLALSEFALGLEALDRFVRREPLRRVHERVFGVLALESEPVDPRL